MAKQRLFTASAPIDLPALFVAAHDEDEARTAEIMMVAVNGVMDQVRTAMAREGYAPGDPVLTVTFDCKGEKA